MYLSKSGFLLHQLFLHGVLFITGITCLPNREDECPRSVEPPPTRLSKDVVPRHYNISITVSDLENFAVGESKIDIEVLKPTKHISFHSQNTELYYDLITLSNENNFEYKLDVNYSNPMSIIDLYFEDDLSPGYYTLFITYQYPSDYLKNQEAIFVISVPQGHERK